jgi:hypothetical protein
MVIDVNEVIVIVPIIKIILLNALIKIAETTSDSTATFKLFLKYIRIIGIGNIQVIIMDVPGTKVLIVINMNVTVAIIPASTIAFVEILFIFPPFIFSLINF